MALWSGKGKTVGRIRALQLRCFLALKSYMEWKKHSKTMLGHKARQLKISRARLVFQAWHKNFKVWKAEKDKQTFDLAVKTEIQLISANYAKEIDTLRARLEEAGA